MFQGAVFVITNTKRSCLYHQYFCSPTDKLHNHIFLPTITKYHIPITYASDHEGRAVGVAALWGYFINRDVADSISADICTTSAEVSKLEVRKPTINRYPIFSGGKVSPLRKHRSDGAAG